MIHQVMFPDVPADTPLNQSLWFLAGYLWAMGFGIVAMCLRLMMKLGDNKIDL